MTAFVYAVLYTLSPQAGESLADAWNRAAVHGDPLFATGVLACPQFAVDDPDFDIDVVYRPGPERVVLEPVANEEETIPVPAPDQPETDTFYDPTTPRFRQALREFKEATIRLGAIWEADDVPANVFGTTWPKGMPAMAEFASAVQDMVTQKTITLSKLPPKGTIVRAKFDLDCGGHGTWPAGWTGEIEDISGDYDHVSVQAHRYLGPNLSEWDNSRVISHDDGHHLFEEIHKVNPYDAGIAREHVLAVAFEREFEVC